MKYMFGFMLGKASWVPPMNESKIHASSPENAAEQAREWYNKNPSPFSGSPTKIVLTDENLESHVIPYGV